jgi:hypothetical protein
MLDGAILPSRIHRLKDQQDRVAVGCVEKLLQCAQLRNVLFQKFLIVLLRFIYGLDVRRPLPKIDLVTFLDAESLELIFISILSAAPPAWVASVDFGISLFRFHPVHGATPK